MLITVITYYYFKTVSFLKAVVFSAETIGGTVRSAGLAVLF